MRSGKASCPCLAMRTLRSQPLRRLALSNQARFRDCLAISTRSYPGASFSPSYKAFSPARRSCFTLPPSRKFSIVSSRTYTTTTTTALTMSAFYNLKAEQPGDKVFDFEQLKGKVVLIVNVASKWCAAHASARFCRPH